MITVTVLKLNNQIKELLVVGHAESAPKGQDLVCSAVSAIVTGGLNALSNPNQFEIKMKSGHVHLKANEVIAKEDEVVLNTILIQLQTIEESYGKYLQIKMKGDH